MWLDCSLVLAALKVVSMYLEGSRIPFPRWFPLSSGSFFPLPFLEAHLNCPCLSKLLQSSLAYAVATSLNNDAQLRCLAMSSDNALCSSCGRKPLILKKSHSPRPLQHIIRWPLGISRMRYQNWDVLVFPDQCKIPLQEFKTACQVIQDPGEYHIYPAFLNIKSS